jgi:phage-related protein
MEYRIRYYSLEVQEDVMALPVTLQARYINLTRRMIEFGPNLGLPHTDSFGGGLFELRLKGAEGIARVFFWRCPELSCRFGSMVMRIMLPS